MSDEKDPRDVFPPIKEGQFKDEDVVLSSETVAFLRKRAGGLIKKSRKGQDLTRTDWNSSSDLRGCFLCVIILEDFKLNGKLTGHPSDIFGKGTFPVESKVRHIEIERYTSQESDHGKKA